jgi:hypothetical protein
MGTAAREHVLAAGYGWERTFELLLGIYAKAFAELTRAAGTTRPPVRGESNRG